MDKTVREAVEEEISSLASSLPRGSMGKIHIDVLGDDGEYVTYRFSREQDSALLTFSAAQSRAWMKRMIGGVVGSLLRDA